MEFVDFARLILRAFSVVPSQSICGAYMYNLHILFQSIPPHIDRFMND